MHNYLSKIYALFFLLVFLVYMAGSNVSVVYLHLTVEDSHKENIGSVSSCEMGSGATKAAGVSTSSQEAKSSRVNSVWSSCNTIYSLLEGADSLIRDPGKKEIQTTIPTSQLSSQLFVFLEPDPPRWA